MNKLILIFSTLSFFTMACSSDLEWVSTTEQNSWVHESGLSLKKLTDSADVVVDTTSKLQTIEGFGACFNELGWTSLSLLTEPDRNAILKELFEPGKGGNFNICRMPVGANDFSLDWYSYNETEGDFDMKNFSIANDEKTLIPFIKAALSENSNLKIWASPWSPPSWLKWNKHYACSVPWDGLAPKFNNHLPADKQGKEGSNLFIQEDSYFKAYALYFAKFIEEYRKQGIAISTIMPQNEFNSCQIFPSCTWTSQGLATFIGKYLGPTMDAKQVEIMFGTMERPSKALIDTILNDSLSGKYIKGIGFQWAGKEAIPLVHAAYPNLKLYQSEQECGDGKNDWKYCMYAWSLMKHYFNNGVSAYMYWNISLTDGGFSRWGWQQNSLITVDSVKHMYKYNHEYYLMKHASHYIKQGAKRLKTHGKYDDILAFQNPDKSIVLLCGSIDEKEVKIKIGESIIQPTFKASSINTILIK